MIIYFDLIRSHNPYGCYSAFTVKVLRYFIFYYYVYRFDVEASSIFAPSLGILSEQLVASVNYCHECSVCDVRV